MTRTSACPRLFFALAVLSGLGARPAWAIEERGGNFLFLGKKWALTLDSRGSILSSRGASPKAALWKSGADGLWSARLADGTLVRAVEAAPEAELSPDGKALTLKYLHEALEVTVTAREGEDGVDWSASATSKSQPLTEFALPARLRFSSEEILRLVTPAAGHDAPGLAFKPTFFARQSPLSPASWQKQSIGPSAYEALFGAPPTMRDLASPASPLQLTSEGREWLGEDAAQVLEGKSARVTRPPAPGQADVTLVSSADGAYLSGSKLKGNGGFLWRIGGAVEPGDAWAANLVARLAEKIARPEAPAEAPEENPESEAAKPVKIALLALRRGPARGDFAGISVEDWRARLKSVPGAELVEIANINDLERALAAHEIAAIVNPYGESLPTSENQTPLDAALKVAGWVRGGGHWIETGGFSFFQALRPAKYFSYGAPYPGSFAHFFHLDGNGSTGALYCVQPQREAGWKAAEDNSLTLVPSRWSVGGDDSGAFLDAPWTPWAEAGSEWKSPIARMTFGGSAIANAQRHAFENEIKRSLRDKMPLPLLEKFKRAVFIYYGGDAASKIAALKYLPPASALHFADYLRGGFDKQLPDHLPPNKKFGTSEQMSAFFEAAKNAGHIVEPYTNSTWWSDNPPGPTFLKNGPAPLQQNRDKTNTRETYGAADGWTASPWHPAVRAASAAVREQFAKQLPADVLFQDQVGARSPVLDFNAASPVPHAYMAGILAQAQEDSAIGPLSTENGWDHLVNWEARLCGMTFATVPTENRPPWSTLLRERFAPDSWEVFPLAQAMAHEKAVFTHHDLGQSVTNREVMAWSLALGYSMLYRTEAAALEDEGRREWLKYLDRVQKAVCAPMVGAPLRAWEYIDRSTIAASYGNFAIEAKLEPGKSSWRASSPQVLAADDGRFPASIVATRRDGKLDVWLYAEPGKKLILPLPAQAAKIGAATVTWDGAAGASAFKAASWLSVPAKEGAIEGTKYLWHAVIAPEAALKR